MFSECDEVAEGFSTDGIKTFDDALRVVRAQMGDQGHTVICNTADALFTRALVARGTERAAKQVARRTAIELKSRAAKKARTATD